jgi:hypothetical protein
MCQRAEKSRLKTWGPDFIGSVDFPPALIDAIGQCDPAGMLLPSELQVKNPKSTAGLVQAPGSKSTLLKKALGHKSILNLSGGADKLVPYSCSLPFLSFLKKEIGSEGVLDDRVFAGVGHECTPEMQDVAVEYIVSVLAGKGGKSRI